MEDHVLIEHRLNTVEVRVGALETQAGELDEADTGLSDRVFAIEFWRNGNGAKGAEGRLQDVEVVVRKIRECIEPKRTDEEIEKIAGAAALAIVGNARSRDKTGIERIKAAAALLNPILSALALIAASIIAAVVAT